MRFNQRKELADKYREWVKQAIDNNQTMILDCVESVMAFLDINGYLNEVVWIPCSERLPEYDEEVLCFTTSEEMVVGHLDDEWGQNVWTTGEFASGTFDALAWMPLPEPWKGEEE